MSRAARGLLLYGALVAALLASYGGVKRLLGWGRGTWGGDALCLLLQIGCSKGGKNEAGERPRSKNEHHAALLHRINANKVRKLSDDEQNKDLLPYVNLGNGNHTVVNLFDYFVRGKKRDNGDNEIFVNHIRTLHRIVVICFKPTLNFSHIITQPSDALHKLIKVGEGEISTTKEYPVLFYRDEASWGMKNVLSTGIIEFFAPPFTRTVSDIVVRCANTEINETYTFEDVIKIRIRIPRSSEKILGVSTDPEDREFFERIVDENVDDYEFGSFKNRVLGFKLADADLDPENCFKTVYDGEKKLLLELEYQFSRCLILDRPDFKLRFFYINDKHFEDEITFSCSFTYKGKKKKATFGEDEVAPNTDAYMIDTDKKEFQYFNGVPYKVCHFEYDEGKKESTQVCERTIDEFSLFMYNCETPSNRQVLEEPVKTIRYLNGTHALEDFSDITLFSKDVHIENLRWKFPDYKYFMTAYINHGPHPLIIECVIPNKAKDKFQKGNIFLHVKTNLKDKTVSFCDFKSSKLYDYLNAYIKGDVCEINVTSNSSFGFRCPDGTVKKPSLCFTEMYYLGYLYRLGDLFAQNIVIYSYKDPSLSLAAFTSSLSRSYSVECFCVQKGDQNKIEKRVIVNYVNEDQLYDYNPIPKVAYPSVVAHPMRTHLCDFMGNNPALKPTRKKPVNYICDVFPKPMEYIALNCPTNLIDEQNEKILSDLLYQYGTPGIKEQIRAFGKKRNNYSKSFHLPKAAPAFVINRYMQNVKTIDEMIPGVLVQDTVRIKIARIKKTDAGVEDPSLPPDESDEINQMYAAHLGLPNSIHRGLFIFQLPPFIKRNAIIEFACINDKTKKMGNTGNNGIMSVHLRMEGSEVHGCHFYKGKEENSILKKKIKVGSGQECSVQSNGEIEYIGIICPVQNGLYLTPPGCFQTAYDSSDALVQLSSYDGDFKNFSNDKGVSYLKIPQSFVGHLSIFCYCNEEAPPLVEGVAASLGAPKKENLMNVELNTSNRGITNVQKIDHLFEADFLIGNEFTNRRPTPILRKKHICDFTREDSSLAPRDELPGINSCFVDLEENLSLVEVRCPRNANSPGASRFSSVRGMHSVGSVIRTAAGGARYGNQGGFLSEDHLLTEEELSKYKHIKYVPEEFEDVVHLNSKKKLQDILPGTIILDGSKKFGEKGRFTFITPLIVKNDIIIKLFCDNSETVMGKKRGKKGVVVVKIPKRVTKKRFYGCDFSGNANKTFYYSEVHSLTSDNKECHVKLKENIIVSLNCPNGKINPKNCFHNVYIRSTMDQENVESVENIFKNVKVINTNYLLKNSSAFLIISKMSHTKDLKFYCTCEDYDSKNVGTIFLSLPGNPAQNLAQNPSHNPASTSERKLILDVPPYYAKDTYVCDFTEQHYTVVKRSQVDVEKLLNRYLQNILSYQHDEFTHFSLNFKLRKEVMKKQYIEYVKRQIQHYRENPPKVESYPDHTLVYKCNIDLSAFDKVAIKCPPKGAAGGGSSSLPASKGTQPSGAPRLVYTSSLGNDPSSLVKGLNSLLFGTIIVNKTNEKNVSFFEKGEIELIISPYADSSKNLSFSCENMGEDGANRVIGYTSIFVKKNSNKILGCDFIDPSDVGTSQGNPPTGGTTPYRNNSFEFEIELVEGKNIYCNIEAIENDVVGFSCPHNFLTAPENCFESVQIEGVDKELETHKLEKLLKGVHILKNKIYDVNYTPSYVILPKKIAKSMKIFCTCNSVKLIKTGIIQINIIGDDLNNWFKKEITHNVFAFERASYFYDFSSGPLNISSENVLDIDALPTGKRQRLQGGKAASHEKATQGGANRSASTTVELLNLGEDDEAEEDDAEEDDTDEDEADEVEEENVLNPMRTKQVHEITVAASEFSSVKVVCPLRNAQHFRQSKISPENFFEYVYVVEGAKKDERSDAEKEKLVIELVQGKAKDSPDSGGPADGSKKRENEKDKDKDEMKIDYDEMGNKIIVALKTERPKATIEDAKKLDQPTDREEKTKKDILTIKNIDDVIKFVNHEREVSENTYAGTIHFSPLLLNDAKFFISCDNSLTLNESRRGKTGIVKVVVKPNYVNIYGCDFVGDYSTHFSFSQKWEDVPKNYVCEVPVEDDSIVGLACPSYTKLHPSDCFDSVIKENVVHKKDSFIEAVNIFLYKQRNKPILSFIQVKRIFASHFSCKCYHAAKGDYKEVTIKINYEPYVMGAPRKGLGGAVVHYRDADLPLPSGHRG